MATNKCGLAKLDHVPNPRYEGPAQDARWVAGMQGWLIGSPPLSAC